MPHSSESTWSELSREVSILCGSLLREVYQAEEKYQDMLEGYQYAGGNANDFADLLHGGTATVDQQAKTTDLINAMTAIHQLYQCLNNVDTSADDRAGKLRRMS